MYLLNQLILIDYDFSYHFSVSSMLGYHVRNTEVCKHKKTLKLNEFQGPF